MTWTIEELATRVNGQAVGRAGFAVAELRAIDNAGATCIAPFFRKGLFPTENALPGAVLAGPDLADFALANGVQAAIVHRQPTVALAELIELFHPPIAAASGIHPSAHVDPGARIHPTATVGPMAVIEAHVHIGEESVVGPGAVVCRQCRIGRFVRIGPGAVIGAEGFGVVPGKDGPVKLRHVGTVVIEDYVDIGANSCVDRATLGTTTVGRASKLDNLVQVGHNSRIGERVFIAGQVGLAGSTIVEDDVMLGGQVGIADHVTIGARAKVAAKSGVIGDVAENEIVAGFPAVSRTTWLRAMAWLVRLGSQSKGTDAE